MAAAALECQLQRFHDAGPVQVGATGIGAHAEAVHHHVQGQALGGLALGISAFDLALGLDAREAAG